MTIAGGGIQRPRIWRPHQWALELADLLLTLDPENAEIRRAKASGLMTLARQETSANGRHYYLAYAKELLAETE